MEIIFKRNLERGGKEIKKEDAIFQFSKIPSLLGGKPSGAIKIDLFDKSEHAGFTTIEEPLSEAMAEEYVQLRMIKLEEVYQGGNASQLLYERSIQCAEDLSKKLLFDSSLTIGAYKSFKKLENLGYKIIENPEATFDGTYYTATNSWVLRVERLSDKKEEK